ncbi:GNAT family N-acetyltransferase [Streptomyces paradoxus]|uniref:GNAT family N-acetyltransferase n=1 Tax=Streptomyces paradoxus TaxID=66375 RepID=UPI00362FC4B1
MRPARPADVEAIAELRAVVMRPDLERLGRYDEHRVRQRLRDSHLAPALQGRGLGSAVLGTLLSRTDTSGHLVRLNVLQGSPARHLYERHGFTVERQDAIDVFMLRLPGVGPRASAIRITLG